MDTHPPGLEGHGCAVPSCWVGSGLSWQPWGADTGALTPRALWPHYRASAGASATMLSRVFEAPTLPKPEVAFQSSSLWLRPPGHTESSHSPSWSPSPNQAPPAPPAPASMGNEAILCTATTLDNSQRPSDQSPPPPAPGSRGDLPEGHLTTCPAQPLRDFQWPQGMCPAQAKGAAPRATTPLLALVSSCQDSFLSPALDLRVSGECRVLGEAVLCLLACLS